MGDFRPPRLAIVVSHPIQHFCPLYRGIAADGQLQLKVFFASAAGKNTYYDPAFDRQVGWGTGITDGFDHEYLPDFESYDLTAQRGHPDLAARLADFEPDIVQVYGYGPLARNALLWALRTRRPSLMFGDSELLHPRSRRARVAKAVALPVVFRLVTGFITIGEENERYYRHYGVSPDRLWRSPIPIDSPLLDSALEDRDRTRGKVRESWALAESDIALLAVGKSIARKKHDHLLRAMATMPATLRERTVAVFAGGGPESDALAELGRQLGVRIILAGFLSIPELISAYLAADVLVHPSAVDPHPLAIAEGVYTALPVVLSDRVGSWGPTDDVRPCNGLRYRYGDVEGLGQHLAALVGDDALRGRLAAASARIGRCRSSAESVHTYVQAVQETLASARGQRP